MNSYIGLFSNIAHQFAKGARDGFKAVNYRLWKRGRVTSSYVASICPNIKNNLKGGLANKPFIDRALGAAKLSKPNLQAFWLQYLVQCAANGSQEWPGHIPSWL